MNQGVCGGVLLPCVLVWVKFFRNLRHELAARKPFHDFGNDTCQRDRSQVRLWIALADQEHRPP